MAASKAKSSKRKRPGKVFRLSDYPFIFMANIIFRINQNILTALRPLGISIPMWRVLAILQEEDGLTLGQLSDTIFVERSALSRVIDGMEEAGLVRRESHRGDRRYTRVFLRQEGLRTFDAILPAAKGQIEWALQGLDEQRLRRFRETMQHILKNYDRAPFAPRRSRTIGK